MFATRTLCHTKVASRFGPGVVVCVHDGVQFGLLFIDFGAHHTISVLVDVVIIEKLILWHTTSANYNSSIP